jgi:hypothetical protein
VTSEEGGGDEEGKGGLGRPSIFGYCHSRAGGTSRWVARSSCGRPATWRCRIGATRPRSRRRRFPNTYAPLFEPFPPALEVDRSEETRSGALAVNAARLFFASRRSSHHVVVRRGAPTRRRPTAGSIADLAPPRPPPSLTTEPRGEARDRDALPRRGSPRHARPFVESVQLRRAKLPFPRQVRARVALHRGGAHGPFRGRPRGDRAGDP